MTTQPRWIEYVPLDDLRENERNPKEHDLARLSESVQRFGYVEPVVIDERTGRLVSGHGRRATLRAAREAGLDPPDGVVVDSDGRWCVPVNRGWSSRDDAEASAYLIAANRLVESGGWNDEALVGLLRVLDDTTDGLVGVGFDTDELEALAASLDASSPWSDRAQREMPDAAGFASGQVWDVGPHRVVVGDARDPQVWSLLPRPQLLVTDPPYGIAYSGGGVERAPIEGDATIDEACLLLESVLAQFVKHAQPGSASYIFLPPGDSLPPLLAVVHRQGLHRHGIVWVKDSATFDRCDFHYQHENISYGWVEGAGRLVPVEDRTLTSVWRHPRPRASKHHPTEKPVDVCATAVAASSQPGFVVMDPFAGSGSTLVAAATRDRVACGIELRPEYARVAVDRLVEATGEKAQQVNT